MGSAYAVVLHCIVSNYRRVKQTLVPEVSVEAGHQIKYCGIKGWTRDKEQLVGPFQRAAVTKGHRPGANYVLHAYLPRYLGAVACSTE